MNAAFDIRAAANHIADARALLAAHPDRIADGFIREVEWIAELADEFADEFADEIIDEEKHD